MIALKFNYTNWHGDDHEYVIEPKLGDQTAVTFRDGRWCLSGAVITRDGDPRENMWPTRRRTFVIAEMRNVEEVELP